jgi:nicotinamide-nucleotide amidase
MITESVTPLIQKLAPKESTIKKHVIVKTWHVPESKIFKVMAPNLWQELTKFGSVSSLPHFGGVDIGVEIEAKNESELIQKEEAVLAHINQTEVKNHIWHIGPESLEEVIVKTAISKKLTIGFAESCTGGLCASRITDVAGSSAVFLGSIVSYANSVKENALQVKTQTLIDHGVVSLETAHEMAKGAREKLQVDIAIATTGIAGPGGGSDQKPVGTVGIGFATKDDSGSEILHFLGDRLTLKQRFSQAALFKLLELIRKS